MEYDYKNTSKEIYTIAIQIYSLVETRTPQMIIYPRIISNADVEDYLDYIYYFDKEDIEGAIIKQRRCCDNQISYYITSTVKYTNSEGNTWVFAKVRITENGLGEIELKGKRCGSCFSPNYADEDFLQSPDTELHFVLESLKENIKVLLEELNKDPEEVTKKYDPNWVKKLIRENKNKYKQTI